MKCGAQSLLLALMFEVMVNPVCAQQAPIAVDDATSATASLKAPARPTGLMRNVLEAQMGDVFVESGLPETARLAVYVEAVDGGERLADIESEDGREVGTLAMVATGAAALDVLGPHHTWATTLEVSGSFVEKTRTFKGLVLLRGGGDPSFLSRTSADRKARFALFDEWARALRKFGMRRLDGRVVGDDSLFEGPALGPGWESSESAEWWSAEVRALTMNDGVLEFDWAAGGKPGKPLKAKAWPGLVGLELTSNVLVAEPGAVTRPIRHYRHAARTEIHATGSLPAGARATTLATVDDPARWAAERFARAMRSAGIRCDNPAPATRAMLPRAEWPEAESRIELARHTSPPLGDVLPRVLRDGHPLYAECFLRALAVDGGKPASFAGGDEALAQWARKSGVARHSWLMADGSGLSTSTRLAAREVAEVMQRAASSPNRDVFVNALAVAGQPGTLEDAFARQGSRVRGVGGIHKTGSAVAVILDSARGRGRYVVVLVIDGAGDDAALRRGTLNDLMNVIDDAVAMGSMAAR